MMPTNSQEPPIEIPIRVEGHYGYVSLFWQCMDCGQENQYNFTPKIGGVTFQQVCHNEICDSNFVVRDFSIPGEIMLDGQITA